MIAIIHLQRGIPSKRKSSACIDYVPALCTHRPSHLPIEWFGEGLGSRDSTFTGRVAREVVQTSSFRGRWSRNKVSVGEPAEGSLPHRSKILQSWTRLLWDPCSHATCEVEYEYSRTRSQVNRHRRSCSMRVIFKWLKHSMCYDQVPQKLRLMLNRTLYLFKMNFKLSRILYYIM